MNKRTTPTQEHPHSLRSRGDVLVFTHTLKLKRKGVVTGYGYGECHVPMPCCEAIEKLLRTRPPLPCHLSTFEPLLTLIIRCLFSGSSLMGTSRKPRSENHCMVRVDNAKRRVTPAEMAVRCGLGGRECQLGKPRLESIAWCEWITQRGESHRQR